MGAQHIYKYVRFVQTMSCHKLFCVRASYNTRRARRELELRRKKARRWVLCMHTCLGNMLRYSSSFFFLRHNHHRHTPLHVSTDDSKHGEAHVIAGLNHPILVALLGEK